MPSAPYFVQPSGSPISRSLSVSVRKRIQPPFGSPSYQKAKGVTSLAKRVGKGSVGNPKLFRKAVSSCLFAAPRIRKH